MTKQTALGDSLFVGQYDLSGDVGALSSVMGSRAVIDVSSIAVSGYERLLGRADGKIDFAAFYNPSASQSHPVLSAVGTASGTANTIVTYVHGATIGNDAASMSGKQIDYAVTVAADMSIALAISAQGAAGAPLEWGQLLTSGKQTFAAAGTTASFDNTAAHAFGGAAYLHSISIASGTATVAVQDSADNATFANVTGLAFTATTAAGFERLATTATATVRRYLRVNVTGTFTNLVCLVNVVVYPTSQT